VYLYDRYDIWQVDPAGAAAPLNLSRGQGRRQKTSFRYEKLDKDELFFKKDQDLLLRADNETTKHNGIYLLGAGNAALQQLAMGQIAYALQEKAKNADRDIFNKSNYQLPPDIYTAVVNGKRPSFAKAEQLSHINPQQQQYNWGTAALFKWTAYNGQPAEGILYKPEDFDSTKRYPMI